MQKENKDPYNNLKVRLAETNDWPSQYLYKFIYLSNPANINKLKDIFKPTDAKFDIKNSKNNKYTSVSVRITAKNPDFVIGYYKKVNEQIENVILL